MERSSGIFLHKIRYRDNSVVAHVLLPNGSLRPFVVHGIQGARQSKAAFLVPLQELELVYHDQENRELITARTVHCPEPLRYVIRHSSALFQAQFMAELLYKCLRAEPVHDAGLYHWLKDRIQELDTEHPPWWVALKTAAMLPELLGFGPDYGASGAPEARFNFREGGFDVLHSPLEKYDSPGRAQTSVPLDAAMEISAGQSIKGDLAGPALSRNLALLWGHPSNEWEALGIRQQQSALLRALCHYLKTHVQHLSQIKSLDVFIEMGQ